MSAFGLTPYEPGTPGGLGNVRGGGHPVTGKTRGQTFPVYVKNPGDEPSYLDYDEEDEDFDPEDFDETDAYVNKIRRRTDAHAVHRADIGARRDVGNAVTNVGGYLTMEFAGDHTTPVSKGLSPRLTYRTRTNTKGPAMGAGGGAMYIRNKPGRQDGTQFGTSRAPLPKHYEDEENIWSLSDIDPYDNAVKRQNKIRNYIHSLED